MAQGASVTIGSNGEASITITAEDGVTKGIYTVTVGIAGASSETAITALTLTIGDTDYPITFGTDRTAKVELPAGTSIPGTATVQNGHSFNRSQRFGARC